MTSKLSLSPKQLEVLCEYYRREFEKLTLFKGYHKKLQHDLMKMVRATPIRLHKHVVLLRLALSLKKGLLRHEFSEEIPQRTLFRDFEELRTYGLLETRIEPRRKGRWGAPGSRGAAAGRPASRYWLKLADDTDPAVDDSLPKETQRLHWLAKKFLLSTSAYRDALIEVMKQNALVFGKVAEQLAKIPPEDAKGFIETVSRIPEFKANLNGINYSTRLRLLLLHLETLSALIPDEYIGLSLMHRLVLFPGETIPREEASRLIVLLGY